MVRSRCYHQTRCLMPASSSTAVFSGRNSQWNMLGLLTHLGRRADHAEEIGVAYFGVAALGSAYGHQTMSGLPGGGPATSHIASRMWTFSVRQAVGPRTWRGSEVAVQGKLSWARSSRHGRAIAAEIENFANWLAQSATRRFIGCTEVSHAQADQHADAALVGLRQVLAHGGLGPLADARHVHPPARPPVERYR